MNIFLKFQIFQSSSCNSAYFNSLQKRFLQELAAQGILVDDMNELRKNNPEFNPSSYKYCILFIDADHCQDAVSGAVMLPYSLGILPVVFGATYADVSQILPDNSFISVDNFTTTNDLADYLNNLNHNQSAYMEYFEWRHPQKLKQLATTESEKAESPWETLCEKLWNHTRT